MARKQSPVAEQRKLLGVLKDAREALEYTQQSVADALDWSPSKVLRIEQGKSGISVTDLRAMLLHYGITESDRVAELVELVRAAKRPSWMSKYKGFGKDFVRFVELESVAVRCRYVQASIISGLLQTRAYATAVMGPGGSDSATVQRGVEVRLHRQEILGPDGPEIFMIIDESAFHRVVGGPEVMREQLLHIKEVAAYDNVSVQVMPFSAGVHSAMKGSFSILELSEDEEDYTLFAEQMSRDTLHKDDPEQAREYLNYFYQLEKFALPASETPRIIDERLKHLGG